MGEMTGRTCLHCQCEYHSYNPMFCSRQGKDDHQRRSQRHTCQKCGVVFLPKAPDRVTYCSQGCAWAAPRVRSSPIMGPRRAARLALLRTCKICGEKLPKVGQTVCSGECRAQQHRLDTLLSSIGKTLEIRSKVCVECGTPFTRDYGQDGLRLCCSTECQAERNKRTSAASRREQKRRRRAQKAGVPVERFRVADIFDRDEWRCQLCGKTVDATLKHPHRLSASLDHVIPLARGGSHTRANVQLAHMICNVWKGTEHVRGRPSIASRHER